MSKKKHASNRAKTNAPAQRKPIQAASHPSRNAAQKKTTQKKLQPWMVVTLILIAVAALGATAMVLLNPDKPKTATLPTNVTVAEAYELYNQGAFVLDVRTQAEWDEFHAPNTTLIPLGELEARLNELPEGRQVVVVCRSGNRSVEGRDILLRAGFDATSMDGGLNAWRDAGYPVE